LHLVAISQTQRQLNPAIRYAATIANGLELADYPLGAGPREDYLVYIGRANHEKRRSWLSRTPPGQGCR
jgi:hypothetical protein